MTERQIDAVAFHGRGNPTRCSRQPPAKYVRVSEQRGRSKKDLGLPSRIAELTIPVSGAGMAFIEAMSVVYVLHKLAR